VSSGSERLELTQKEDRYNASIEQLLLEGKIKKTRTGRRPVHSRLHGQRAAHPRGRVDPQGTEFWMETNENEDKIQLGNPRSRAPTDTRRSTRATPISERRA